MATTYDNASLVMIPSGVKEDKLYSIKPTDGSGDFTFSRGTDTATRVNASGLIEKERGNLAIQSNSFSTSWSATNATLTSGQSGYDGSSDAWSLSGTGANARVDINNTSSGLLTWSVYAKAGSSDFLRLRVDYGAAYVDKYFDLSNGSLGGSFFAPIISNIEAVGATGWYRCSVTLSQSISTIRIYTADVDLGGSSTGNIYIQDAMLNQGLVAQPYIETTTAAVYEGITDNLPRLDYSGGASCPSLLLEGSRTNGLPQSEYFNAWSALNGVSITPNSATSPEGVQNASLMTASGAGSSARSVRISGQSTSTDIKTMSVYAKANTHDYIQLFHSGDAQAYVNFDLSSGEVGTSGTSGTGDIEPMENDWYRCIATFDSGANFGSSVYVGLATSSSAPYGGGSISDTSLSVYIFGAQYETGSYPTSYIPTMGTSASRAADVCNKSSATSIIGQTEGTMFVEAKIDANSTDDYNRIFGISQGNDSYRIIIFSNDQEKIALNVKNAAVSQVQIVSNISPFSTFKAAVGYSANDFVFYINGQQIGTDSSGTVPACDTISLGTHEDGSGTRAIEGNVKQALLFDTRLTNAELAALTTL